MRLINNVAPADLADNSLYLLFSYNGQPQILVNCIIKILCKIFFSE